MLEDEGMVFTGLLVGLNVIDCNMCIKEEDLDQPVCTCTLKILYNITISYPPLKKNYCKESVLTSLCT